ncbi:MAG: zinc-ribbon domain-containing protein [Ruminococcus sp.]|nr:zinc-ribbon domain-containing protein [Ruminococcus sp.]
MKNCVSCGAQLNDDQAFCTACGAQQPAAAPQAAAPQAAPQAAPVYAAAPAPAYDPYDHTSEFDPQDISDNKCYAMLIYLMSVVGIIIALLASKDSPYIKFHLRQAIKIEVCTILLGLAAGLLCWTFIAPFAALICIAILSVIKIICFFQICGGKAKEPAIVRGLKFLK